MCTPKSFFLRNLDKNLRPSKDCSELRVICRGHAGHGLMCSLHTPEEERDIFVQRAFRSVLLPELSVPACMTEMYLN